MTSPPRSQPGNASDVACERCRFWDQYKCYRFPQAAPTGARHWCGEFHIDEIIERDRQRRDDAAVGHQKPTSPRKPLTADTHWGDR